MARKFKLKYLIISMFLIAVITVSAAVSVSYASWVGSTTLTAGVKLGTWKIEEVNQPTKPSETPGWTDINVPNGIYYGGIVIPIKHEGGDDNCGYFSTYNPGEYGGFGLTIYVKPNSDEGQSTCFKFDSNAFNNYDADHLNLTNDCKNKDAVKCKDGLFIFYAEGFYKINVQVRPGYCDIQVNDGDNSYKYIDLSGYPAIYHSNNGDNVELYKCT